MFSAPPRGEERSFCRERRNLRGLGFRVKGLWLGGLWFWVCVALVRRGSLGTRHLGSCRILVFAMCPHTAARWGLGREYGEHDN